MLSFVLWFALLFSASVHADFEYSAPTQCSPFTITWSGGSPPFSLLLAPASLPARNITIPNSAYNSGNSSGSFVTQLALDSQTVFVVALSDAAGFASLGTSPELTVNPGSSSCDTNVAPAFNMNFNTSNLQQCRDFTFDGFAGASQPITVYGLIASGTGFTIQIPQTSSNSYQWNADIMLGTNVLFAPQDSNAKFATSSDFLGVGSSDSSSCLNSTSPQSTTKGQQSRTSSSSSRTSTGSSSGTASPTGGSSGGGKSSNAGAIAGGVVGGIAALVALLLLLFCLRKRKNKNAKTASGFNEGAFGGGKGRRGRVDLLPGGGINVPDGENAAHYPLNAHHPQNDEHLPNDYEPVPYVLPAAAAAAGSIHDDGEGEYETYNGDRRSRPSGEMSTVGGTSTAGGLGSKSAMASMDRTNSAFAPNAPARFLVHTDAGSVIGDSDEEGEDSEDDVVDLPPTYNSLGVLITPERRPSRRRSQRRPAVEGSAVAGSSQIPLTPTVPRTGTDSERAGPSSTT